MKSRLFSVIRLLLAAALILASCSREPVGEPVEDGKVITVQTAAQGRGVDLVFMGDGFTASQIRSGYYRESMEKCVEFFFSQEPMKSFRQLFNVYYVIAVSQDEGCSKDANTCFMSRRSSTSTHMDGNEYKVQEYAKYAIGEERMMLSTMVVMMNTDVKGGTTFMYSTGERDCGEGRSICFVSFLGGRDMCRKILIHEAAGHGIGKLGDEYAYQSYGMAPKSAVEEMEKSGPLGFYRNLDTERNSQKVKWAHFINDPRYANEGIAVYQGGNTYWDGIYRSTYNSIMGKYDDGDPFNAPSREAIYYNIHKLALGDSWTYDWETFVEYDSVNRK